MGVEIVDAGSELGSRVIVETLRRNLSSSYIFNLFICNSTKCYKGKREVYSL